MQATAVHTNRRIVTRTSQNGKRTYLYAFADGDEMIHTINEYATVSGAGPEEWNKIYCDLANTNQYTGYGGTWAYEKVRDSEQLDQWHAIQAAREPWMYPYTGIKPEWMTQQHNHR